MDPWSEGAANRDKSQTRQIQLTETIISDRVDGLDILPTKELVKGLMTWTERQGDGWTPYSRQVQGRHFVEATWHLRGMSGIQES